MDKSVKMILGDGNQYTFSVIGIGHFRKHSEASNDADVWEKIDAHLELIAAALKKFHPDVTVERVAMDLITYSNAGAALDAVRKASGIGAGEDSPVATQNGTGSMAGSSPSPDGPSSK